MILRLTPGEALSGIRLLFMRDNIEHKEQGYQDVQIILRV